MRYELKLQRSARPSRALIGCATHTGIERLIDSTPPALAAAREPRFARLELAQTSEVLPC
jgi:hypothetical protein